MKLIKGNYRKAVKNMHHFFFRIKLLSDDSKEYMVTISDGSIRWKTANTHSISSWFTRVGVTVLPIKRKRSVNETHQR